MSPPDESTKAWLRSWPIYLTASVLAIAAGWALFREHNGVASAALFTLGTVGWSGWFAVEMYRAGRFDGTAAGLLQDPDSDSEEQADE